MSSVAMFPAEDFTTDGILDEIIRRYISRDIKNLYGLSLTDYLNLPVDVTEALSRIGHEELSRKDRRQSETMQDIEREFGKK